MVDGKSLGEARANPYGSHDREYSSEDEGSGTGPVEALGPKARLLTDS